MNGLSALGGFSPYLFPCPKRYLLGRQEVTLSVVTFKARIDTQRGIVTSVMSGVIHMHVHLTYSL
jgi:hypothetical protein